MLIFFSFSLLYCATYCFSIVLSDIGSRLLSWHCCSLKYSAEKRGFRDSEPSDSLQSGSKARGIHSAQHLQFSDGSLVSCRYLATCIATNWCIRMTELSYLADNRFYQACDRCCCDSSLVFCNHKNTAFSTQA